MAQDERKISAGSYDLNKWLYGGYDKDIITTIYGSAGTGKTNFVLLACVSQAKKSRKIIFIDTEGGFSIERIKQLAGENYGDVLKNIMLLKPTSFGEQEDAFREMLKEIKGKEIALIVIDGITMLYRLELAEARKKSDIDIQVTNSNLTKQLRILAEIARKKNIPVLVTNQAYSEFLTDEEIKAGKKKKT